MSSLARRRPPVPGAVGGSAGPARNVLFALTKCSTGSLILPADGGMPVPAEIRHIVFAAAEVAAAIREYRRHIGRPLPVGLLRRFELQPGTGGVRALFDIVPDNGGPSESSEVGAAEITEALVLYCNAHGVPLPAAGIKSLQRFGDSLLLIVTVNLTGAGWPLSAGLAAVYRPPLAADG
jgi:hypothetical protein